MGELAVDLVLLPITGRRAPVLLGLAPVVLPGATIPSGRAPIIACGVQDLAQVLLRHLGLRRRHLPIDERLLVLRGEEAVTAPQLVALMSRVRPEPLSPEPVQDGLVALPSPLVTEDCLVVTILGVLVASRCGDVATVSGPVAFGAVARRVHTTTVPRPRMNRSCASSDPELGSRGPLRSPPLSDARGVIRRC